jgi:hypothetical protein
VNGKADRTSVASSAKNLPVFPSARYVFAAPGCFQLFCCQKTDRSLKRKGNSLSKTKSVVVWSSAKKEDDGEDEKANHHDHFSGREPSIRKSDSTSQLEKRHTRIQFHHKIPREDNSGPQ